MSERGNFQPYPLFIVGNAPSGMGYPQAGSTVDLLRASGEFEIYDHCYWEKGQRDFWAMKTGSKFRMMFRVVFVCLRSFISVLKIRLSGVTRVSNGAVVYFPYPAIFSLLAWSIFCRRCGARRVCDAYISIYDSAVVDRGIAQAGWLTKILFWLERKALHKADRVIVDTVKNEDRLSELFALPRKRFVSMPIAIPEDEIRTAGRLVSNKSLHHSDLVFFGAISPLHGIDIVLEAFSLLRRENLSLTIVGDGQSGYQVAEFMAAHPSAKIHWIRDWQPLESLAPIITRSSVCLGVFGGEGKASSVLPLKAYISLCLGKPFVTQDAFALPASIPTPPFITCRRSPDALAETIETLLADSRGRHQIANASSSYFAKHLSKRAILEKWRELIEQID